MRELLFNLLHVGTQDLGFSALGRWKQADPWGSLVLQAKKFTANKGPCIPHKKVELHTPKKE